jgi:hypothetical protein
VNARASALSIGGLSLLAVGVQYLWPRWPGFHTWEYATVLAVGMLLAGSAAWGAMRGRQDREAAGTAIAGLGALLALLCGLASGLLGPDSQTYLRGPGTVLPLPDAGVAAAFPIADAAEIASGESTIDLRKRDHTVEPVPAGARAIVGSFAVEAERRAAAFVRVTDAAGRHMTVTQPSGAAFLSPVLLFPNSVRIGGNDVVADSFTVPALARTIKAIYFPATALALTRGHADLGGKDAVLFVVDDPQGKLVSGGIGLATSGGRVRLAGLSVWPTLGSYPELVVSPVPPPAGFGLSLVIFLIGAALPVRFSANRRGGTELAENILRPN